MRARMVRLAQVIGLLAPLACGPRVQSTLLTTTPPPPRPDDAPVAIVSRAPSCPHAVVGTVVASAEEYMLVSEARFREALARRARAMGGDALIVTAREGKVEEPANPGDPADPRTTTWKVKYRDAVVVRYTDAACRAGAES